ncbi:MAG: HEPN domain-containing protein [bacterium]
MPGIKELHSNLIILNRYYIETRYPGDYPEFSWQEGEQAYESARKIKEFVLQLIS